MEVGSYVKRELKKKNIKGGSGFYGSRDREFDFINDND